MTANNDSQDVQRQIVEKYEEIQDQDYFELLDVDREHLDEKAVTKKFRKLAKKWHADRYSGYDLDDETRQKLQQIFSAINSAHQTLSDADKRREYELELEAGDQDIGAIIDAENAFRKGQNMLQTGSYKGAHRQFQEAYELNPEEIQYEAHVLYTEYLQIPKNDAGKPLKRSRAEEIYERLDEISHDFPEKDWLLEFLGVVAMGLGKMRQAEMLFNECLTLNPRNTNAQRQKRLIKRRREREQNKGFFEKLLDKFK